MTTSDLAVPLRRVNPAVDRGGEWVALGGEEYKIPPLNFRALRELQSRLAAIGSIQGIPTETQMMTVVEVVHAALKRNYPDITVELVEDLVDVGNMMTVFTAVLRVAGMERRELGKEGDPKQ